MTKSTTTSLGSRSTHGLPSRELTVGRQVPSSPALGSRSTHGARSLPREIPVGQSSSSPALGSRSTHGPRSVSSQTSGFSPALGSRSTHGARSISSHASGYGSSSPLLGSRSNHGSVRSLPREIPGQVPSSPALGSRSTHGARSLPSRELPEGASASATSFEARSNAVSNSYRVGSNNGSHLLRNLPEAPCMVISDDFTPVPDEAFYYLKAAIHVCAILIYERHGLCTELGDEKFVQHGKQLGYEGANYEFTRGLEKGKLASYRNHLSRYLRNEIETQRSNALPSTSTWNLALPSKQMIPLTAGGTIGGLAITAAGLAGLPAGALTAAAVISGAVVFIICRKLKANREKADAKLISKYLTDESCNIICEMVIALLVQHTTRRIQDILATKFSINLTNPVELLSLVKQLTSNEPRKPSTGNYSAEMQLIESEAEKDAEKLIEYLIKYEKNYEKDPKKYSCSSEYIELLVPDFAFQHQRNGDIPLSNLRKNLIAWLSALVNTIKKHSVEYQQNFKEDLKLLKQERTFALYCLQAQDFAKDTEIVANSCIADRDIDEAGTAVNASSNTLADAQTYLKIAQNSLKSAKAIATTFVNATHLENTLNGTEEAVIHAEEAVDLLEKSEITSDSKAREKFLEDASQAISDSPKKLSEALKFSMSCNTLFFRSPRAESGDLMSFSPSASESGSRSRSASKS